MANVQAIQPAGKTIATFIPTQNFADIRHDEDGDPVIVSKYVAGMIYRIREGNDQLLEKVKAWRADGKVEVSGEL